MSIIEVKRDIHSVHSLIPLPSLCHLTGQRGVTRVIKDTSSKNQSSESHLRRKKDPIVLVGSERQGAYARALRRSAKIRIAAVDGQLEARTSVPPPKSS